MRFYLVAFLPPCGRVKLNDTQHRLFERSMANRYFLRSVPRIHHPGLELAYRHDGAGHPLHASRLVCQPVGPVLYRDGCLGAAPGGGSIPTRGDAAVDAPACGSLRAWEGMSRAFWLGGLRGCVVVYVGLDVVVVSACSDRVRTL